MPVSLMMRFHSAIAERLEFLLAVVSKVILRISAIICVILTNIYTSNVCILFKCYLSFQGILLYCVLQQTDLLLSSHFGYQQK